MDSKNWTWDKATKDVRERVGEEGGEGWGEEKMGGKGEEERNGMEWKGKERKRNEETDLLPHRFIMRRLT